MDSSMARRILPLPKRRVVSLTAERDEQQEYRRDDRLINGDIHGSRQTVQPLFSSLRASEVAIQGGNEGVRSGASVARGTGSHQHGSGMHDAAIGNDFDEEVSLGHGTGDEDHDEECSDCRDWLDNVKNKKKRKIPTSAAMGHSGSSSTGHGAGSGTATAVPFASSLGQGLHLARQRASLNAKQLLSRRRRTWDAAGEVATSSTTKPSGPLQETTNNTSKPSLVKAASAASANLSKPFDFSCESPVARNLPTVAPSSVSIPIPEPISVATQTTPSLADLSPILPPRHTKTPSEKEEYRMRLLRKQRRELKAKLKPGEQPPIWVCQFCEFESIFGFAPLALIDGYNERMRSVRRAAQERARLLEKARAKGKKKKKAASTTASSPASTQPAVSTPASTTAPSNRIEPTLQNGGKKGIDKAIGPTHAGCTCCGGYRREDEAAVRNPPPARDRLPPPPSTELPPVPVPARRHSTAADISREHSGISVGVSVPVHEHDTMGSISC